MPTLRSSGKCQGPQGFSVSPIKSTRKVRKVKILKKKVAFATSSVGQSDLSSRVWISSPKFNPANRLCSPGCKGCTQHFIARQFFRKC